MSSDMSRGTYLFCLICEEGRRRHMCCCALLPRHACPAPHMHARPAVRLSTYAPSRNMPLITHAFRPYMRPFLYVRPPICGRLYMRPLYIVLRRYVLPLICIRAAYMPCLYRSPSVLSGIHGRKRGGARKNSARHPFIYNIVALIRLQTASCTGWRKSRPFL